MLKLFLGVLAKLFQKTALFLPSQCVLFPLALQPRHGSTMPWSWVWSTSQVIPQVSVHPWGHCSLGWWTDRYHCGGVGGWGVVYTALSTTEGFAGCTHHCTRTEQFILSEAHHPEAQQVSVFLCRHQFLLCVGTNVFVVVLWKRPGDWSGLKPAQPERGKKWTLIWLWPLMCFTNFFHKPAVCPGT